MDKERNMVTFDHMAIREEIKKAREAKNLSYRKLAKLCPTISASDISDYEKGKRNPSLNKLEILSKALGGEWKFEEHEKPSKKTSTTK